MTSFEPTNMKSAGRGDKMWVDYPWDQHQHQYPLPSRFTILQRYRPSFSLLRNIFNDNKLARVITKYPPHYVILESDDVDKLVDVYENIYESFDESMVELQNHGYAIEHWNEYIFYNSEKNTYQFVSDDKETGKEDEVHIENWIEFESVLPFIFSYASLETLESVRRVCKKWNKICLEVLKSKAPLLWTSLPPPNPDSNSFYAWVCTNRLSQDEYNALSGEEKENLYYEAVCHKYLSFNFLSSFPQTNKQEGERGGGKGGSTKRKQREEEESMRIKVARALNNSYDSKLHEEVSIPILRAVKALELFPSFYKSNGFDFTDDTIKSYLSLLMLFSKKAFISCGYVLGGHPKRTSESVYLFLYFYCPEFINFLFPHTPPPTGYNIVRVTFRVNGAYGQYE